jgi:hypothetical protein
MAAYRIQHSIHQIGGFVAGKSHFFVYAIREISAGNRASGHVPLVKWLCLHLSEVCDPPSTGKRLKSDSIQGDFGFSYWWCCYGDIVRVVIMAKGLLTTKTPSHQDFCHSEEA